MALESLAQKEREFLLKNTDLTEADLSPESLNQVRTEVIANTERLDQQVAEDAFTAREVARLLSMTDRSVDQLVDQGKLYAIRGSDSRRRLFPRWQFVGEQLVPHLDEVIPALPQDYHPADVEHFVTTPRAAFDERAPKEWLATTGDPEPVIRYADGLSWC